VASARSTTIKPDPVNGERIYRAQCAACHGPQGEGIRSRDGQWIYPPLWGEESFNIGAGMARTYTAAAFVKRNMPIALHDRFPLGQGGLSDQDAVDVAEFFTHQPRPDFAPSQGLATGQEAGRCTLLKRGERCGAPSEPLVGLLQVAAQLAEAMIGPVAAADLVAPHEDDLAFQVGCRSGPRAGCHRAGRWCRGWA
jgi:cytochrome c553